MNDNSLFRQYREDEAKHALFAFLEKYGLTTYTDSLDNLNITDSTNRLVAHFILDESKSNSSVFQNLIELTKGFFLSKAIYLDNNNNNLFNASMKDIVLILDAPLMLKILGLKTAGENRVAKEFLQSLPSSVKLRYLYQNLDELKNIIQGYKQQKILQGTYTHTLEYFDENAYTSEAIDEYYSLIEKKLLSLKILEYTDNIPFSEKYAIDDVGLSARLKEKISSYKYNERALENDVESISAIYRLRKGIKYSSIENCKAIFITNNIQLAYYTNQFLGDTSSVGCVMTETDFTILMWLKNKSRNTDTPKEILLANAYSAIDEVTDGFMSGVFNKIRQYENEGGFDVSNMGVILENIFYRRELADRCNGDPNNLSTDDFRTIKAKYDEGVVRKANIDVSSIAEELGRKKLENDHITAEHERLVFKVKDCAKKHAKKKSSIVFWLLGSLIYTVIIAATISGTVYTILDGLVGEINALAIAGIALGILGTIDLILSKCKFIVKMLRIIRQRVYDKCYYKEIAVLDSK